MKSIKALIAIALIAPIASTGFSQTWKGSSFISTSPVGQSITPFATNTSANYNTQVFFTNNTTTAFNASSVLVSNYVGNAVFGTGTNVPGIVWLSLTNMYGTNVNTVTLTNVYNYPAAWGDVPIVSDRNGNPCSATFYFQVQGIGTTPTNTVSFTLAKLYKDQLGNYIAGTTAADKFTYSFAGSATTIIGGTNLPTTFTQGAAGIRLQSVVLTDSGTASGQFLSVAGIAQSVP